MWFSTNKTTHEQIGTPENGIIFFDHTSFIYIIYFKNTISLQRIKYKPYFDIRYKSYNVGTINKKQLHVDI